MEIQGTLSQAPATAGGARFIESITFPWREVSEASAVEKGPGRPPHWEMVFWWTRKPLISARAIIAGCLLPENTPPKAFLRSIGIGGKKRAAHNNPPAYRFNGVRLLDPFAGFGSIPLEGARLGLDATAVELLPTAYVFLKAVLEYPARYGKKLVEDVERWGEWVAEQLKSDPLIKELYDEDVAVYIGSWEIKCPHCGRLTPLVGNWWLARVKGSKGYERLAWMEPVVEDGKVKIAVVDLNAALGKAAVAKARVSGAKVAAGSREFKVPESNIEARREKATCLLCGQPIMQIDPETGKHYTETKNLPREVKNRLKGYVKFALELYNKGMGYGTNTELPPWTSEVPARQKLLVKVKVKQEDLEFEPCTEKDQEKLEKAKEEVKRLLETNDPDVPREPISLYSVRYLFPILYGMTEWYKLFNPRQLLTLVKLVKLIREAGKQIEQEKIKEGLSKEEAFKYAEAIVTMLAVSLVNYERHNAIVTSVEPTRKLVAHALASRGLAMTWNWVSINPFFSIIGSWVKSVEHTIEGLSYLESVIKSGMVKASLDDATILSKLAVNDKFDLLVTDPPYYDDVPYAELSDFYYVWLKRALSDIEDGRLVPKFLPEAFFEKVGDSWVEVSTQWEKYAISEVSLNPPRLGASAKYEDGVRHFQNLLNASFIAMASRLVDDGLLVTYYAHTDPDAWKALLEAGWEAAGLRVVNAFPITTESAQSVVKRGKLSMDTSIVVVWRKGSSGSVDAARLYEECIEAAAERARELMALGIGGRDLFINVLAAALAKATSHREVIAMGKLGTKELVENYVYPAACLGLARAFSRKAGLKDGIRSPDAMLYLLLKSLGGRVVESTDLRIFSIGTSMDAKAAITDLRLLLKPKEAGEEEEGGAKVAKAKAYVLAEPSSAERKAVEELLEKRGVGVLEPKIRCAVDALHVIELFALKHSVSEYTRKIEELKAKHPSLVQEALALAKVLGEVLPEGDAERELCRRVFQTVFKTT
jgi:putative DNA methylase